MAKIKILIGLYYKATLPSGLRLHASNFVEAGYKLLKLQHLSPKEAHPLTALRVVVSFADSNK